MNRQLARRPIEEKPLSIDFKVNKTDLIDIVIDDRLSKLEEEITAAQDHRKVVMLRVGPLVATLEKEIEAAARKTYAKLIKAHGAEGVSKSSRRDRWHTGDYDNRCDAWDAFASTQEWKQARTQLRSNPGKYKHSRIDAIFSLPTGCEIKFGNNNYDSVDGAYLEVRFRVTKEFLQSSKSACAIAQIMITVCGLDDLVTQANAEIALLTKRGARFKAQLIRKMLEETSDGRELLDRVGDFTDVVKQALLDKTAT